MKLNSLNDIYLVSERTVSILPEEIETAKSILGTRFPPGYDEFMLRFGVGDFAGYLRPYPPSRVVRELKENRDRSAQDFWVGAGVKISRNERAELIPFADTIDADSFAFHPRNVGEIYVFPRHDDKIYKVGPSLLGLLEWVATSGTTVQPFSTAFFQPWNDYASLRLENSKRKLTCEEMKVIFQSIGVHSHLIEGEDGNSIDYFIRGYGAHLNYLRLNAYAQFIIRFDQDSAPAFVNRLEEAVAGKGFKITEHHRVRVLPNLG
jgi:hypothetical protein